MSDTFKLLIPIQINPLEDFDRNATYRKYLAHLIQICQKIRALKKQSTYLRCLYLKILFDDLFLNLTE